MLSILIPTYNYNVVPLVLELHKQCSECEIEFEILVQDDASSNSKIILENSRINNINNCTFSINSQNLGRGQNINSLCHRSKYDYVLIMEADALPESDLHIKNYIELLPNSPSVIFGGVKYPTITPPKEKILRWKYGVNRETKSLNYRLNHPYSFVFTWNLLLRKDILLKNPFPEFIQEYGYEDVIFIKALSQNFIPITHIENPLIHINDEYSIDFIKKTEKAIHTLHTLIHTQKIYYRDTKLSVVYSILKKTYLTKVFKTLFIKTKKIIIKNLTSERPLLFLLDAYKLGHFCSLNSSKNV